MDRGNEFSSKNVLKDDPKIYEAYALYFVKYVEAYKKAGIDVDRILIQNEQDFNTKYPSCRLLVEQMSKFVKGYMRPLFTEKKVDTEIWAGTFRAAGEAEALKFAANSDYMEDFDGIGIQYTRAQYMHDMTLLAPNVKFMHTEGVCFNGGNTIDQAKTRLEEVAAYINSGSENFCYWNMILNESGLSGWGWKQNALINIDRETKSVTYNPDYAVMNLMSKYVQPDAVRIGAFSYQTMIVTKKGGDYFIVMQNDEDKDTLYNIYIGNELVKFAIPANSLCGVKISK